MVLKTSPQPRENTPASQPSRLPRFYNSKSSVVTERAGSNRLTPIDLGSPVSHRLSPIDLESVGSNRLTPIDLESPASNRLTRFNLDSQASSYFTAVEYQSSSSSQTQSEERSVSSRTASQEPEDTDNLTQDKISRLEASRSTVPNLLFRAYSTGGGRCTKGRISQGSYWPATVAHSAFDCYASLYEMAIPDVQRMAGNHLAWQNPNHDDFISWTRSILFAIEHALGRYRKGQFGCQIAAIEPARATTVGGDNVPFYWATEILDVYDVSENVDLHWKVQGKLQPRIFTHEVLSHGVVNYPDTRYRHVPLQEIIDLGLFETYPEFSIPSSDDPEIVYQSAGLFTRCTALRYALFPRVTALLGENRYLRDLPWEMDIYKRPHKIPRSDIIFAFRVAQCFVNPAHKGSHFKPPLHIALMILALRRRPLRDRLLARTIAANYCADDLKDILYDGISEVPDNLPEVMQYLELLRHAGHVLKVPPVAPTVVEMGDLSRSEKRYRLEDDNRKPEHANARIGPALYTIDNDRTEMSRYVGPDQFRRGKRTYADFQERGFHEGSEEEPIWL